MDLFELELKYDIIGEKIKKFGGMETKIRWNEVNDCTITLLRAEHDILWKYIRKKKELIEKEKIVERTREKERAIQENTRMKMELKKLSRKEYI